MNEEKAERSWGVELWDQSDALLNFTSEQNSLTLNYMNMLSDLQKMHQDVAKKYRKTVSPYMLKKKSDSSDLSYQTTFYHLAQSYYDMANYHEELSNNLATQIIAAFKELTDRQRIFVTQKTKHRQDLLSNFEDKKKVLEKSWSSYLKTHKDKIVAKEQSSRAQKDEFLPRIEVKKFEETLNMKNRDCNNAGMKYANDLRNFNEFCSKFYNVKNMDLITEIEELDVKRVEKTKEILENASDIHTNSYKKILDAIESNKSLAGLLDHRKDRVAVLNKYSSEYFYPPEAQFLDLDKCPVTLLEGPVSRLVSWLLGEPLKATTTDNSKSNRGISLFHRGSKKKEEMVVLTTPFFGGLGIKPYKLNEMFITQIDKRIVALNNRYEHLSKELAASNTMENIYSTAPSFGDADSVEKRVACYNRQLKSIELIRDLFGKRYEELGGDQAKIECFRRIDQYGPVAGGDDCSNVSDTNIYERIDTSNDMDNNFDDSSDEESKPINNLANDAATTFVGKGKAIYDYAGNGDSYLPAVQGQTFEVIAFDDEKSGWTAVVDTSTGKRGYVPTDFIEITRY